MPQATAIVPDGSVRPGYNGTGTAIAANRFVIASGSRQDSVAYPAADTETPRGVTMQAIADTAYGDIQTGGEAVVEAGEAIALHGEVAMTAATGKAKAAASGDYICGIAGMAATADGDKIIVDLNGPGIGRLKD